MMLKKNATRIQMNLPTPPWFGLFTMDTTVMMKMIRPTMPPSETVMGSMPIQY